MYFSARVGTINMVITQTIAPGDFANSGQQHAVSPPRAYSRDGHTIREQRETPVGGKLKKRGQ